MTVEEQRKECKRIGSLLLAIADGFPFDLDSVASLHQQLGEALVCDTWHEKREPVFERGRTVWRSKTVVTGGADGDVKS